MGNKLQGNVAERLSTFEVIELQEQVLALTSKLDMLHNDILFIKDFVAARLAKAEEIRRKQKEKRLEEERIAKARHSRAIYERLIDDLRRRPFEVLPCPASGMSRKELELASLLARDLTDEEIATKMNFSTGSISPRISAIKKKLKLKDKDDIIRYYLEYREKRKKHRRQRCITILSWLMNPPPGIIRNKNLNVPWIRTVGNNKKFRYGGPYIPSRLFARLRPYEEQVLGMKLRGVKDENIAKRLKVKPATLRGYMSDLKSTILWVTGTKVRSDAELIGYYKKIPEAHS